MDDGGRVVCETDRLRIRRAEEGDVDLFVRLWNDPRVMDAVGFPEGLRIVPEEVAARLRGEPDGDLGRLLVVERRDTGDAIGECKLGDPDANGIASTDVKLLPSCWKQGYGVEVKRALLAYLFTRTGCRAVEATPNVENAASIRMQEAVGGVRIAEETYTFPESMRGFTRPVRFYRYRVHREEWERRGRKPS